MIPLLLEELELESRRLQRERTLAHERRLREARVGSDRTLTARGWFAERLFALGMRVAPAGTQWECVPSTPPNRRLRAT
jgi:hypothetical protein